MSILPSGPRSRGGPAPAGSSRTTGLGLRTPAAAPRARRALRCVAARCAAGVGQTTSVSASPVLVTTTSPPTGAPCRRTAASPNNLEPVNRAIPRSKASRTISSKCAAAVNNDGVHAFFLRVDELTNRDLDAWRTLANRAAEPNPFFEPAFVMAAVHHLRADDVSLLVVEKGREWIACLPVESRSLWHRYPARWLTTWLHPYCFLGTPLVDRDRCDEAVEALVNAIHESGRLRLVALELLGSSGPVSNALTRALAEQRKPGFTFESFERAALHRRHEPTYLDQTLRPSRRKELRRLERRLGEQLKGATTVWNATEEPRAIEDFLRLEASGWKGREGTALSSNPEHAAFFREFCSSLQEDGRVQLLVLGTPARAIAMQCNILAGRAVFCFKVAYDERFARYSPGMQLEVHAVDDFHAQSGVSMMDSCADSNNNLVNRLWPDRVSLATVVVPAAGLAPKTLLLGLRAAVAFRRLLRRVAAKLALAQRDARGSCS